MRKFESMHVNGHVIKMEDDYICLTDMVMAGRDAIEVGYIINNWLQLPATLDFLAAWEQLYNQDFRVMEFVRFKDNSKNLAISNWVGKTLATGIYVKQTKDKGIYAHKDIAFEFGSAISAVFKLYLIKEYQRLKELEANANNPEWGIRRVLSKTNYVIQTDAVKYYKLPAIPEINKAYAYSEEADILNIALFGFTAKTWRDYNLELAIKKQTPREYASINELIVLANIEVFNAEMIKDSVPYDKRLAKLKQISKAHLAVLNGVKPENSLKKNTEGYFQPFFKNDELGMFPVKPIHLD